MAFAACGKIELVGNGNGSNDLAGNSGSNDLTGQQQQPFDMVGQPVAVAKATPIDQPTGAGAPVFLPLAGLGVKLESTGSSDPKGQTLSFSWKVLSAPAGSAINDAALMNPTTATSGFVPDLGGAYQIELTVTTTDSRLAKSTITVTAQTSALFFLDIGLADMTSFGQTLSSIRSDGTGRKALGCPDHANVPVPADSEGSPILFSAFGAISTYRPGYHAPDLVTGIEAPARIIAGIGALTDMGTLSFPLSLGEEDSSCATKAPKVVTAHSAGIPLAPVWSPNRSRFLYSIMEVDGDGTVSMAVATDTETTPITGLTTLTIAPIQPAWIDDTHILFVTRSGTGPYTYQIYAAALSGGTATDVALWADCATASANWFGMQGFEYRNGAAFIGLAAEDKQFNGYNVFKIAPGTGTTTCSPTNLTQTGLNSSARDFAISPDGKWLVYAKPEADKPDMDDGKGSNGPPAMDLHILDIALGTSKKLVGDAGTIEFGPQFIAGGRQIMFYSGPTADIFDDGKIDMGGRTVTWKGISVINLDGTNPRALLGGTSTSATTGSGPPPTFFGPMVGANYFPFGGCGVDPLQSPLSALASSFVLLAAIFLGVRRRKS